jgi:uncharacterized membrane protein YidH (DUF202 family)
VTEPRRDPGLAYERTTLAWQRTGLSSAAVGAICVKVFWGGPTLGLAAAGLLVAVGALTYAAGRHTPVDPPRLRALSLGTTLAAALCLAVTIVE